MPGSDKRPAAVHLSWYLSARVGGMTLILLGAVFYQFWVERSGSALLVNTLYFLIGVSYLQALVGALCLRKGIYVRYLAEFQIFWDLFLASCLVGLTGGPESFFTFVYLLVIVSSSFFLSRRNTFAVTCMATLLYSLTVVLQQALQGGSKPPVEFVLPAAILAVAFFLTAYLSSFLAERWRSSVQELQRKSEDYLELEELNRAILANIGSGLMLVNLDGRIQTFNRAAIRITGLDFDQVRTKKFDHFFPGMVLQTETGDDVVRGEFTLPKEHKQSRVLGYATTRIKHVDGRLAGTLVTFQDLTEIKALEGQLRRADRLAAIGRMARGMAHEIRNPLASISGSVQFLLEKEQISEQGCRLMNIVEREADRLSALLDGFLDYAKPAAPRLEQVDTAEVLDELSALLGAEVSRQGITLKTDYKRPLYYQVDRAQFRQALWNLLVNAREAAGEGGWIRLTAEKGKFIVEDSGPGIAPKDLPNLFEPFFTTKDKGTGLGLATVHSIVSAHNGTLIAENRSQGGARFVIQLPSSNVD